MKIKHFIIFFLLGLLFWDCKKYPEDKSISLKPSKDRLEGEWQIEKIEVNGDDVGYKYNDSLAPLNFKDYKLWFVFGWRLDTPSSFGEEADLLIINKSSKNKSDAVNDAEVSGLAFGFDSKKRVLSTFSSDRKKIPVNDSIAFIIFKNLIKTRVSIRSQDWEVRSLQNKILILEKTANTIKKRIYFKKN